MSKGTVGLYAAMLLFATLASALSSCVGRARGLARDIAWINDNPRPADIQRDEQLLISLPGIDQYSLRIGRDGDSYWAFYVKNDGWLYGAPFKLAGNKLAGAWKEERIAQGASAGHERFLRVCFGGGQPIVCFRDLKLKHCFLARRDSAAQTWQVTPLPKVSLMQGLAVSDEHGLLYLAHLDKPSKKLRLICMPLDDPGDKSRTVESAIDEEDKREAELVVFNGLPLLATSLKSGGIAVWEARVPAPQTRSDWQRQLAVERPDRQGEFLLNIVDGRPALAYTAGDNVDVFFAMRPPGAGTGSDPWPGYQLFVGRLGGLLDSFVVIDDKPAILWSDLGEILILGHTAPPGGLDDWCCSAVRDGSLSLPSCQLSADGQLLRAFWVEAGQELRMISYPAAPQPRLHSTSIPDRWEDMQECLNGELADKAMEAMAARARKSKAERESRDRPSK